MAGTTYFRTCSKNFKLQNEATLFWQMGIPNTKGTLHMAARNRRGNSRRRSAAVPRPADRKLANCAFFKQNFANFRQARSRLYQNEILQENMRLTAFFKLYKICILLHRCNLKILAKNRCEKSAFLRKFSKIFAKLTVKTANLTGLVLGCIDANFCIKYAFESSR